MLTPSRRLAPSALPLLACFAAAAIVPAAPSHAQTVYRLLPATGYTASYAQGIDPAGAVVGYSSGIGGDVPTLWQRTGTTYAAQLLPLPPGAATGGANAITSTGLITGYVQDANAETATAVVWAPAPGGGYTAIPLPNATNSTFAGSYSINASGQVAGFVTFANGTTTGAVWTPGPAANSYAAPLLLPAVPNQTESAATVITDSGLVGGYTIVPQPLRTSPPGLAATFWEPNGASYAPKRATANDISTVVAFNANGLGAGVVGTRAGAVAAYAGDYYVADLTTPSPADGAADAINASDYMVGMVKDPSTSLLGPQAALWAPTDEFWSYLNLDAWLDSRGRGSNLTLTEATAINDAGLIAGNGLYSFGQFENAFVLDAPMLVPEPATAAVLSLVLLPLALCRSSRRRP